MRKRHLPAVLLLVPLIAGCGGTEQRRVDASAAAAGFERALAARDPAALCAYLAPGTRSGLTTSEGAGCTEVVLSEKLRPGGKPEAVNVHGRQARVVLRSDTLFLSQFSGGWKVVAAGCTPQPGEPYECTVKG